MAGLTTWAPRARRAPCGWPALAQLGHLDQRERESPVTDEARPALVR